MGGCKGGFEREEFQLKRIMGVMDKEDSMAAMQCIAVVVFLMLLCQAEVSVMMVGLENTVCWMMNERWMYVWMDGWMDGW